MFSHSKKEHIRNDKKCSEEIRTDPTFQVKITTELLGVFGRESTVEYCFDVWVKFSPFFIFLIVIWLWHPSGTPRNYKIMLVRAIIY